MPAVLDDVPHFLGVLVNDAEELASGYGYYRSYPYGYGDSGETPAIAAR